MAPTLPVPKVFVVHGHDGPAKRKVVQFLEARHFEAVVLNRRAGGSRTLIEKIEASDAGFAVVLLTADDEGRPRPKAGARRQRLRPRARQNVLFEWGFFIARLGRHRVRALYERNVEMPSDLAGVDLTPLDARGAWRKGLERELESMRAAHEIAGG